MASGRKPLHVAIVWAALLAAWGRVPFCLADNGGATGRSASPTFSPEVFLGHVYYLASDEVGGRRPATPGMLRAGQYIADQFAAAGIEPAGEDETYFQPVPISVGAEAGEAGELVVSGADLHTLVRGTDYVPFNWSSNAPFEGEVVFVGYGLVDPGRGYDDYAGVDVSGKVVLMLRREPPSLGRAGRFSRLARFENKVTEAKTRGAVGMLLADRKTDEGDSDKLDRFRDRDPRGDYGLPAFHVTRKLADKLLAAGGFEPLEAAQAHLDAETPTHCSAPLTGVRVSGDPGVRAKDVTCRNVVGMIRGMGPQRDEYVAIGAHYDHLGLARPQSFFGRSEGRQEEIHNGADDNASGAAGVIELGKALAHTPDLNRSVLLIAFTGEELGLLGSRHFVEHPTVPLDRIVAVVNLDMIGRMAEGSDSLWVYGTGTGEGIDGLVHRCAADQGLQVLTSGPSSGQSDEYPFCERGVPGIHFFTGIHEDLHRPTDDAEKINEQDAVRVLHVVYEVARELVDRPTRPAYCYTADRAALGQQPARAVMGFWPAPVDEGAGRGIAVERTLPNGPADRAGIMAGDRIIQIDEQPIAGPADYAEVIGDRRPGETVHVIVEREGRPIALTVILAAG